LGIALSYLLVNLFYGPFILFGFEFRLPPTDANRMVHSHINIFWAFAVFVCFVVLCETIPSYIKAEIWREAVVVEKRGWRCALTSFVMEVWGETEK
jgi:hypothetical protein